MKFGFRRPSIRKRIAARTSVKRVIRHSLGLKAPRGWGWLTNPRRALYNRAYYRSTFGIDDLFKIGALGGLPVALGLMLLFVIILQALLPLLLIIGLVGVGFFVAKKAPYIQAIISRFFLKEDESNDLVLSYREMVNRALETIRQASKIEKAILTSLAIVTAIVYVVLFVAIVVRLAS